MPIDLSTNFFYDRGDWEHFINAMLSGTSFRPTCTLVRTLYPREPDGFQITHYNNHWVALSYSLVLAFLKDGHIIFPAFEIEVPLKGGEPEYYTRHHIAYMHELSRAFTDFRHDVNVLHDRLQDVLTRFNPDLNLVSDESCAVYVETGGEVIAHDTITCESDVPRLLRQVSQNLKSGTTLSIDADECLRNSRMPSLRRFFITGRGKDLIDNYVLKSRRKR